MFDVFFFFNRFFFGLGWSAGRNVYGRITVFHSGGGVKRRYRFVDFFRNLCDYGVVVGFFLDSECGSGYMCVCYLSGFFSVCLRILGVVLGQRIYSGWLISFSFNPFVVGSAVCLDVVSVGTIVCCVELFRFFGAQLLRSAGVWGKVVRNTSRFAFIWLRSGVVVSVGLDCLCVLGRVFGVDWNLRNFSNAGTLRRLGFRPVVRGEAMNPVDHPHGGRTSGGRIPVTPWGRVTKGLNTVS